MPRRGALQGRGGDPGDESGEGCRLWPRDQGSQTLGQKGQAASHACERPCRPKKKPKQVEETREHEGAEDDMLEYTECKLPRQVLATNASWIARLGPSRLTPATWTTLYACGAILLRERSGP